jgi:hypothetical protein
VFFSRLEYVLADVVQRFTAVMVVWKVLQKKKDPVTHELFLGSIEGSPNQLVELWTATSTQLQEKLSKLLSRPNVQLSVIVEFQRLYSSLHGFTNSVSDLISAAGLPGPERWLSASISSVKEKFLSQMGERYKERITQIVSKATALVPTPGAETISMDISVDISRPALPMAVTALDVKPLVKMISQELASRRQDLWLLTLVMRPAVEILSVLHEKLSDLLSKIPVPCLPPLGTSVNAAQVFHFCVCNAAAQAFNDISGIVSVLPCEGDDQLSAATKDLKVVAGNFQNLATSVMRPFFASAAVVLCKSVSTAFDDTQEEVDIQQQFGAKVQHLASHFLLLFDRAAPALEDEQRGLVARLYAHAVNKALGIRPLHPTASAHTAKCLSQISQLTALLPHSPSGSTNFWKGQIRVLRAVVVEGDLDSERLSNLHPVLVLLHLIQRIPLTQGSTVHGSLKLSPEAFLDVLMDSVAGANNKIALQCEKILRDYEAIAELSPSDAKLRTRILEIVGELRLLRR